MFMRPCKLTVWGDKLAVINLELRHKSLKMLKVKRVPDFKEFEQS